MNIDTESQIVGFCSWALIGSAVAMATGHAVASPLLITYVVIGLFLAVVLTNHLTPRA